MKSTSFTLGIEQEFQLVNAQTKELCSCSQKILERGQPLLGKHLKLESKQSCVELVTGICPTIQDARQQVQSTKATLKYIAEQEGVALIGAGTHPSSSWLDQKTTPREHYEALEEEFQDLERSLVIYGLHIHIGLEQRGLLLPLMNQVRLWLPHLLALSSNSPFWSGRYTGLKSFRSALWRMIPHTGIPEAISSRKQFYRYLQATREATCPVSTSSLCWDIRPRLSFQTLEFRICDMPTSSQETLALAALCQALVMKLVWLYRHHRQPSPVSRDYLEQNKWQAMRYGLDATVIDFGRRCRIPMREALHELLSFVDDVVDEAGSREEMDYLRELIDSPLGTGADRQIALYQQTQDVKQVTQYLLQQTMHTC
jgi:carboxylate-amine ligase